MPELSGNTVWAGSAVLLLVLLAAVLTGLTQRLKWRSVLARPQCAALLGCAVGLAAMAGGFVRYLSSAYCEDLARVELYLTVFAGALIFAASAIAWFALRGRFTARVVLHPGGGVVNLAAFVLCIWMGYGFVIEHTQSFGLAVLLAMSLLAAALGAHLMINAGVARGRYGFAAASGQRSTVRCGIVRRSAVLCVLEDFDWPADQMPALFDDDFAQSWSPLDETHGVPGTPRFGAFRQGRRGTHSSIGCQRGRCRRREEGRMKDRTRRCSVL
ncbi:MAG: NAD(P)(+) transhydrogenase (Re/Si-specific) subunit beta [Paraburkholderia sp.]|jgi:NAD(P) transhydrogenase subunit beta|uniref:NAD(P)(+) transhydrogenase (Re/Si-specific) subunit beta n=1 Tax=Burkholderiaceae TaxID=119060 RepID=UPI0010F98F1D|nr:NAD(P)(+) transhydrogenase (Re/Si-specific) subunit beta [Burkholderia sp. 4M9327F10]